MTDDTRLDRARDLYERAVFGGNGGEGEALFWLGTYEQVVRGDHEAALPVLRRAHELAAPAGVAAGLVPLAYLAREEGRDADAAALLDEAATTARECGAAGVLVWVAEARA